MLPRVLFVSKPIAPPFHDGAKCLVRDVATGVRAVRAAVLTTRDAPELAPGVEHVRLYPGPGAFAPAVTDNVRVLARLLAGRGDAAWHFVFAPNPASSTAGALARAARRVPTVQTVASAPRSFERVSRLLFGDVIVALSAWTRDRLVAGGADPRRLRVIPPAVPALDVDEGARALRRDLGGAADAPLVVYPGDLGLSRGARLVAAAAPRLLARAPGATLVFACRKKTPRAASAEAELAAELAPLGARVRFVGEVASLPTLLRAARVVAFPVDDLWGKVDLPIALLEAMSLGVPIVALGGGPLAELGGAVILGARAGADAVADACAVLVSDDARHREVAEAQRGTVEARFRPPAVVAAYEELYATLLSR